MARNMSAGQTRNNKEQKETYTCQNFLGRGAFGEAYLIKSDETGINYVMKRIVLDFLNENERKKVMNEASLLKIIDHPNIIKFKEVFEVVKPIKQINIIMEYASGGDINQKIKKQIPKHFEENLLIDWLTQLCNALQYIHDKKIIHRDIKPANIFLNNLGQIKLGDFGVSKNLESMKLASTFTGSMDYLAPEIVDEKNYSFEADIWSLGVTFYELMTFKKPFEGKFPAVFLKILNDEVEPITEIYSKEFRNLIYKMLNKDPFKRPKAKEILKMPFVKNRMLSYLQEKRFNIKDSFKLIQNYQRKVNKKIYNITIVKNNILNNYENNYNNNNANLNNIIGLNYKNSNKIRFINNKNNIKTINNNNTQIKYKFNLKSDKEISSKLNNQRYKIFDDKEKNNEKTFDKNKINNFRKSVQVPDNRNKITLSKTKITNTPGQVNQAEKIVKIKDLTSSQINYTQKLKFNLFKNDKNDKNDKNVEILKKHSSSKENSITIPLNEIKNICENEDKDKYDFHRQMNIFSSLIKGVKTDEQIEEENKMLLKNYDYDHF